MRARHWIHAIGANNLNLELGYALIFLAGLGLVALSSTFLNLVQLEIFPAMSNLSFAAISIFAYVIAQLAEPGPLFNKLCVSKAARAVSTDPAASMSTLVRLPLPTS
ncbi:MAG: hypothetical protein M5R42_12650 [Rhodocyclaceae bacterium]|nr:hypothetical protein [Rhodocyclaceae bacterium]